MMFLLMMQTIHILSSDKLLLVIGNAEKFYPEFYKCVSDNIAFRNLSKKMCNTSWIQASNLCLGPSLWFFGERELY